MGTRSLTVMTDEEGIEVCVMYRQMDGYPSWHGQHLADFLAQFTVVNGIPVGDSRKLANGAPCLFAQLITHFKSEVKCYDYNKEKVFNAVKGYMELEAKEGHHEGGIYLHPAGTRDYGTEYTYYVGFDKSVSGEQNITLRAVTSESKEWSYGEGKKKKTYPAQDEVEIYSGSPRHFNGEEIEELLNENAVVEGIKRMAKLEEGANE